MTLTVTAIMIRSTASAHTAWRAGDRWEVSWLPGRLLDQHKAITAMTLAEAVAGAGLGTEDPLISRWAAVLGLSGPYAVALASASPGEVASRPGGEAPV